MPPAFPLVRLAITAASCCAVLALGACRLREDSSEQLVVPEVVRAHLYVAPNGSDSNPGTQDEPFRTIGRAAQIVTPGTTVHVAPGIYSGSFKTLVSGTAEARITFESTEKWGAKIVPPLNSGSSTAWFNRGNYVDIIGFEIDGTQYQGGTKWLSGIYNGGSYDAIRNNHVHHIANDVPCESTGGAGIGVDSYYRGTRSELTGNNVHDIGPEGCRFLHGIHISTQAVVKNNVVYRVSGSGIHLWRDASQVTVAGNTVAGAHTGILVGSGDYYHTKGPNDGTQVHNNIVFDNRHGVQELGNTGKNNSYRNNLVHGNTAGDWKLADGIHHSGTVSSTPGFRSYSRDGTPDFRLAPGSPAIARALPASGQAGEPDFEGKPRRPLPDIGAIEH